jgi:uncharacterized protein YjbJ (UPF0337 family)
VAKERDHQIARQEKGEFRKKGGKAVGTDDSVVDGHLSGIAGSTQETYGGDAKDVRPKLEEKAKTDG